jgi:hypothetical protein
MNPKDSQRLFTKTMSSAVSESPKAEVPRGLVKFNTTLDPVDITFFFSCGKDKGNPIDNSALSDAETKFKFVLNAFFLEFKGERDEQLVEKMKTIFMSDSNMAFWGRKYVQQILRDFHREDIIRRVQYSDDEALFKRAFLGILANLFAMSATEASKFVEDLIKTGCETVRYRARLMD